MASWLKAAEDLFEVVDRRAKLVASDLVEEQSGTQPSASNGQGSQNKRKKSKTKVQKRLAKDSSPVERDSKLEQSSNEISQFNGALEKDRTTLSIKNEGTLSEPIDQTINEKQQSVDADGDVVAISSSNTLADNVLKNYIDQTAVSINNADVSAAASTSNLESVVENTSDAYEEGHPKVPHTKELEVVSEDHPADANQNINRQEEDITLKIGKEKSQSVVTEAPRLSKTQSNYADLEVENLTDQKKQPENKVDTTPIKVQDQLDEAQKLLKTTTSSGQSKEARLARVCAGLQSRLQEYKSENAQLEELLTAERELTKSYESHIKTLQQDLSASKGELTKVESNMAEALAAKNSEIEALVNSVGALKKEAASSEGNLASLQANMESIMRSRELTETRMMQALREELTSVERRAEEERAAHHATKMAAMQREVELEHRAVDSSTALARIQRLADDRTAKAAELEQKVALLEVECASLSQELQDMESRALRGPKKAPEDTNQVIQIQAWQEEAERARQGQRDAESKLSSFEAEVQKTRVEMAAMKRDAEHYSRQEHVELEKRYRELTDLLYYKQTQLESMASEKAAAEFQLEKEVKRLQEVQVEVERGRVPRRGSTSWEDDTELKALEPLPVYHRHMVAASIQLQKAAKMLDSGAVRATRFLWRYPTARIILLFYLVFVHLFLMYLLHRLQEQADDLSASEVAKSMGLANPTLP